MEKKHLIGKKVRGFKFEDNGGCYYHGGIKLYEGKIGIIKGVSNNIVKVQFDDDYWYYPLSEIEKHLVEEAPSQYEVGVTVWDIEFGKGIITRISSSTMYYPIEVKFEGSTENYSKDGKWLKSSINCWYPRLSLTPYDLANGGATFPTFKPKLPEIERGTLVYVKDSGTWQMRFFSHFDEDEGIHCFVDQKKEGSTKPWREYSLTNPLIENGIQKKANRN